MYRDGEFNKNTKIHKMEQEWNGIDMKWLTITQMKKIRREKAALSLGYSLSYLSDPTIEIQKVPADRNM